MHCEKKRAKQSVTSFKVQPSGRYYSALMYQSRRWPIFLILSQYKRTMYEFKGNVLRYRGRAQVRGFNASKLGIVMVTLKSFLPLNVNIHNPGSTNLARIQSWHEAGSCRSQEPGSYLCCHGNKRDWQSFLGSL